MTKQPLRTNPHKKPLTGINKEQKGKQSTKKIATYLVVAVIVVGIGVLLFASIGVAVFLIPLLTGAFAVKR